MKTVFADTQFWVAKINPLDQWHKRAIEAEYKIGIVKIVTSEQVVIEVLNYFSKFRSDTKQAAATAMRSILASEEVEVILQSETILAEGFDLYESRLDKGYSLTDCISMNLMREREIFEILTHDRHFRQEGFKILM